MKCRLCRHNQFTTLFKNGHHQIPRCNLCGFGTLSPLPSEFDLDQIYSSDTYHNDKAPIEHLADAQKKLSHVTKYLKPHSQLLDYGCGTGAVVQAAKTSGFQAYGYDISDTTAKLAHLATQRPITSGIPHYPPATFDAITSFDVIEHIVDFQPIISLWHSWLKSTGYLFITTPDLSSWDYQLLKTNWYGFTKIPQHVNYFDRSSLTKTLAQSGFCVVNIQTWGFTRTLDFISRQLPGSSLWQSLLKTTHLYDHTIYIPIIDMMVIAKKL